MCEGDMDVGGILTEKQSRHVGMLQLLKGCNLITGWLMKTLTLKIATYHNFHFCFSGNFTCELRYNCAFVAMSLHFKSDTICYMRRCAFIVQSKNQS